MASSLKSVFPSFEGTVLFCVSTQPIQEPDPHFDSLGRKRMKRREIGGCVYVFSRFCYELVLAIGSSRNIRAGIETRRF